MAKRARNTKAPKTKGIAPEKLQMSCSDDIAPFAADPLDQLSDEHAAAAFRRLVRHLRHRHDAQNIDLMGLAGFCRNCLSDWIVDAGAPLDKAEAREAIHGMPAAEWKAQFQTAATPEQIARMEASVAKNAH
jgi:hypothetical protein